MAGPIGSEIGTPWRSALEDRDALAAHHELDSDLVEVLWRGLRLAIPTDGGDRDLRDDGPTRHRSKLAVGTSVSVCSAATTNERSEPLPGWWVSLRFTDAVGVLLMPRRVALDRSLPTSRRPRVHER
jgi:hypothetical protein